MKKCLLLGNGGREAVLAEKIAKGYKLFSILPYANPSIVEQVKKSNGKYLIGDPFDKDLVTKFIKEEKIDAAVVSQDNLLQNGLIDLAQDLGLKTFGPTSKGAKIEWSKTYALDIVKKLAPEMVIQNKSVSTLKDLDDVMKNYNDDGFVIKPEGLTGGKGVKVGGVHFKGKQEGYEYAKSCLDNDGSVIVQDKVEGREFTVMALTDGEHIVVTPITFDYPYRFDYDKGPGTGGMGCLSFADGLLPFLNQENVNKCSQLISDTIKYINKDNLEFTGVIYGGFFKCKDGIKFIEFNARFGDPEALNVLNSLETPFVEVLENIFNKNLNKENCKFKKNYTFTIYVVSPDYALRKSKEQCIFKVNKKAIEESGAKIYFASTKLVEGDTYVSVGNSRLFGVTTIAKTLEEAKDRAYNALDGNISNNLDFRKDIGAIYEH